MTAFSANDLKLIRGALVRAIDHEETSAQAWESEIKGYRLSGADDSIRKSRALIVEYKRLDAKVTKMLRQVPSDQLAHEAKP